jgi:large conductance mechanosensitive channel
MEETATETVAAKIPFKKSLDEFADFIRKQGVVGLAIGFILGAAVGKVVASVANDIVQPLIGYLFGSTEGLAAMRLGSIMYGRFLATLIDFIIMAAVVFFVFKKLKLDQFDKPKQ